MPGLQQDLTREELHAQDIATGALQTVQAGGRVHIVKPDLEVVGRWVCVHTVANMTLAELWMDGYAAGFLAITTLARPGL